MAFAPTSPPLARALAEHDYSEPTAVQDAVLEPGAIDRDLLVSAQTGSGKTVAYGLAIATTLLGDAERMAPAAEPLALIVAPTRELALQVQRELSWLYQHAGCRVVSCVGGMDPRAEQRTLAAGVHIVVGTPGRLRDHLERKHLKIDQLKAVVLDEADEMLDLGFREDLEFILEATPPERRTLLFSATLPKDIVALARRYQRDALRISVAAGQQGHADIEYRAIRVAHSEIEHAVVNVLRFVESPTALVFCNTRESVRHLHAILVERGFAAVSLSGEMSQNERNRALQALRDGQARVCVATDVAARGIDLPNLGLVVHAELPQNGEVLQHRSGRTGRAGRKGVSVLLVLQSRRRRAEQLLNIAGVRAVWGGPPTADDISKLDHERLLQSPLLTAEISEEDREMARTLLADRSPEELAAALVRLYRSHLPAAEEVADPGGASSPRDDRGRTDRGPLAREPEARAPKKGLPGGSVWFRLNIGRQKNADPKWLLPLICRQGNITKQDIGAIRVFDRETKFEIDEEVAERFLSSIRQVKKPEIRIELMTDAGQDETPSPERFEARPAHRPAERGPTKTFAKAKWKKSDAGSDPVAQSPHDDISPDDSRPTKIPRRPKDHPAGNQFVKGPWQKPDVRAPQGEAPQGEAVPTRRPKENSGDKPFVKGPWKKPDVRAAHGDAPRGEAKPAHHSKERPAGKPFVKASKPFVKSSWKAKKPGKKRPA